jgi:tetratricopeptide (TPR) repeat protein
VFLEDSEIPLSSIAPLWQLDAFETEDVVEQLAQQSLLTVTDGNVRLHDLVRDYLVSQLPDVTQAHARLLDSWGDPYALPDNYAWRFYIYHVIDAERMDRAKELLQDPRWLQAKLDATDVDTLLADFARMPDDLELARIAERIVSSRASLESDGKSISEILKPSQPETNASIFIIYRRSASLSFTRAVFEFLKARGFDVFMDVESIAAGSFEQVIMREIAARSLIMVILGNGTFERASNPDDWLRRELLEAYRLQKIIIPVIQDDFAYSELPNELHFLAQFNALLVRAEQFDAGMERLVRSLHQISEVDTADDISIDRIVEMITAGNNRAALEVITSALLKQHDSFVLYGLRGRVQTHLGEVAQAISDYNNALELSRQYGGVLDQANYLLELGRLAQTTADLNQAIQYLEQALILYQQIGNRLGEANSLSTLGDLNVRLDNLTAARAYYDRALPLYEAIPDRLGLANMLKAIGDLSMSQSDLVAAHTYYERALPLYEAIPDRLGLANTLTSLGSLKVIQNDIETAGAFYERALALYEAIGDRLAIASLGKKIEALSAGQKADNHSFQTIDGRTVSWIEDWIEIRDNRNTLLNSLRGHSAQILGVIMLTDGRLLSWSVDRTLRLWSQDGMPLVVLSGHTESINGVLELNDGRFLSWSEDRTIRAWSQSGEPLMTLTGHTTPVSSAEILDDGRIRSRDINDVELIWSADGVLIGNTEDAKLPSEANNRAEVYISSTLRNLSDHRKAAMEAMLRMGVFPIMMENFPASSVNALTVSFDMVARSIIHVVLVGQQYGYIPEDPKNPDRLSIVELEYQEAIRIGKAVLVFVMDEKHPVIQSEIETDPAAVEKLRHFKNLLLRNHVVGLFTTPDDLKAKLISALVDFQAGGTERRSSQAEKLSKRIIHVFASGPGDVQEELTIVRETLDRLSSDPSNNVELREAASDTGIMTVTPQEAIDRGLLKPSECDIAIFIFWSRFGTPLPPEYRKPDGRPYLSGTEWEYEDAVQAARATERPLTLVYRRTEKPKIDAGSADASDKIEQYKRVEEFFAGFRDAASGALTGGVNEYDGPRDFAMKIERHLLQILQSILDEKP